MKPMLNAYTNDALAVSSTMENAGRFLTLNQVFGKCCDMICLDGSRSISISRSNLQSATMHDAHGRRSLHRRSGLD